MTERAPGLGRRLGRVFLLQATLISLAAVIGVYAAGTTIEEVLIRRALEEEAEHFWRHFSASAHFPAPHTRNLTGFLAHGADRSGVPASVASLGPGFHALDTATDFSVVYVTERDGNTLLLVFDGERVSQLALWFGLVPLAGVLVILYLSSWLTYRLAAHAVSPVIRLARQVRRLDPRAPDASAFTPQRLPADADREILDLAEALRGLSRNVHEHIERERDFTRDASHELRTPLTVIRLAAGELRRRPGLDAPARETVARIERGARDMEETTEALLLLARTSDSRLASTAVRLDDIVARECERARAMAGSKSVNIDESGVHPAIVDADARVLAVLVGNLLRNAVQYTGDGRIEVRVQADTLSIADTGVGIPREQLGEVFRPFVRAGRTDRPGHGVGLSIVKRLCDRFGWSVRIESTPEIGTRVEVRFPGARPPAAEEAPPSRRVHIATTPVSPPRP